MQRDDELSSYSLLIQCHKAYHAATLTPSRSISFVLLVCAAGVVLVRHRQQSGLGECMCLLYAGVHACVGVCACTHVGMCQLYARGCRRETVVGQTVRQMLMFQLDCKYI